MVIDRITIICVHCKIQKESTFFAKSSRKKSGISSWCKTCVIEEGKSKKGKKRKKIYDKLKRKELTKYSNEYYHSNKEKIYNIQKRYNIKNLIKIKSYRKQYKFRTKDLRNRQEKIRLSRDIIYKIKKRLRTRFYSAIKNNQKGGSAIQDLGCTIPQLKQWLEQQFKPGMTWDNYGQWHIDHIIPLCKFDLSNPKQVKKACHWFNLQPLWAEENLGKGGN